VTTRFPRTFAEIRDWARDSDIGMTEARIRFAQYAILRAITQSHQLSSTLVFKGGNALDFVWQPNRSTKDLDFSADLSALGHDLAAAAATLDRLLKPTLVAVGAELGIACRLERLVQSPPGPEKSFVTYQMWIGYALPDQDRVRRRIDAGLPSNQAIKMEVSVNEAVCADVPIDIGGTRPLRVSTLDDIVAEKLRALLQQPIRNRHRRQDLLDIAVTVSQIPTLNYDRVASFLQQKAATRGVPVSRAAFRNPEIMDRARVEYDELAKDTRALFIHFEDARTILLALVDALPIPDE
jgi:predicted nucleotidyltransferase component of viral defense system